MYTDSDRVGFESGLITAEKPVLAVSQKISPLSASATTSRYRRCHSALVGRRDPRWLALMLCRDALARAASRAANAPPTASATHTTPATLPRPVVTFAPPVI